MRNPELTKATIIVEAAKLFNVSGYSSTSISDITKQTGLTKGAIYRHFENKSALEREALTYLCRGMMDKIGAEIKAAKDTKAKIESVFSFFRSYLSKNHVPGGCPLMNAAIEADDTNPELLEVVTEIMDQFHGAVVRILENGKRFGQVKKSTDSKHFSSLLIASLEGAVMLSRLSNSNTHMNRVVSSLEKEMERILKK